jgi:NitT/TauT family transport system substrate-binding protein
MVSPTWKKRFRSENSQAANAAVISKEAFMKKQGLGFYAPLMLIFLLCGERAWAAPVRIAYSIIGPPVAAVWMAQETGAFKKYGLDVQLIYIPSSGTNVQALLGGSLDVAALGSSGVVLGAARGAPVVAFASIMNRPPMTLYVQPEISRPEQLKGQILGITRFNSSTHTVTTLVLRKLGMAQTVSLRPLGGNPEIQAAFEQKQIAGTVTTVKPRAPANALLNAADLDIPYAMSVMASTRDYLQKNRESATRILRAYIEGVGFMARNKAGALRILAKYLKRDDPAFLEEMHAVAANFTERIPRVDGRTVATILEFEPVKGVDAEALVPKAIDNSLVEELFKEGFIERVFGKGVR